MKFNFMLPVPVKVRTNTFPKPTMRHLIDCFAAYERALIGARTKAALRVKKARGQRVGAIPLGYRLSGDGTMLEPDPREQKAIALVHELRGEGLSLREIDKEPLSRAWLRASIRAT